jgi:hypothetical protein
MKICLFLFMLLLIPFPLKATSYFVDNCVTVGNDSNNGTAQATPWLTVSKVNGSSFNPADTISFRKTCTWHEKLTVPSSGSLGNVITFGAYGSGALPTIDGADTASGWTNTSGNVWQIAWTQSSNQVIRNGLRAIKESSQGALTANYEWYANGTNLFIYTTTNPTSDGSVWEAGNETRFNAVSSANRNYLTFDSLNVINSDETGGSSCFGFEATGVVSGITISNSTVTNCYQYGILFYNDTGGSYSGITLTNDTVDHCFISAGGSAGVQFGLGPGGTASNVTITNLTVTYSGTHGAAGVAIQGDFGLSLDQVTTASVTNPMLAFNGSSGLNIQNGSNGVTVTGGTSHDNGQDHATDDNGVEVGGLNSGSSNITYTQMDIYNNYHSAVEIASTNTNQVASNVTLSFNRLRNSTACDGSSDGVKIGGGHTGIAVKYNIISGNCDLGYSHTQGSSGNPTVLLYGNTIYGNGVGGTLTANLYVNGNNLTAKNNIIANASGLEATVLSTYTLTSDYNDFYHAAGGNFMSYQGTAGTFAQWKTASSQDAHSISADPMFTNAVGSVFTLKTGSPGIGAGVTLGGTYQNALSPNSVWPNSVGNVAQPAIWDIGAFVLPSSANLSTGTAISTSVDVQ